MTVVIFVNIRATQKILNVLGDGDSFLYFKIAEKIMDLQGEPLFYIKYFKDAYFVLILDLFLFQSLCFYFKAFLVFRLCLLKIDYIAIKLRPIRTN